MSTATPKLRRRLFSGAFTKAIILVGFLWLLAGVFFPMDMGGIQKDPHRAAMQQAHSLYLALFSYANDHDQQYPDGRSSTEVFQKLLDGNYVSDPVAFYLPLPGKVPAEPGQKLKPENVAFDVTANVNSSSPDEIPLVFETGYKVDYVPNGTALPISKNSSTSSDGLRTWIHWWNNQWHPRPKYSIDPRAGIAVAYKSGASRFIAAQVVTNPDGSISMPPVYKSDTPIKNFIAPTYDSHDQPYRQLTPDGILP